MKIAGPEFDVNKDQFIGGLQQLIALSSDYTKRPCMNCDLACECSGSLTCACTCSHQCPLAIKHLSIDPIRYPIEKGIIPLVMEFQYIYGIQTCWSCEGHVDYQGNLSKIPRIWFYVEGLVYLPLLQRYIDVTQALGRLDYDWHIKKVNLGNQYPDCFSIEPDIESGDIKLLQKDSLQLARGAAGIIKAIAEQWVKDLS